MREIRLCFQKIMFAEAYVIIVAGLYIYVFSKRVLHLPHVSANLLYMNTYAFQSVIQSPTLFSEAD